MSLPEGLGQPHSVCAVSQRPPCCPAKRTLCVFELVLSSLWTFTLGTCCDVSETRANELRGLVFMDMELLRRLINNEFHHCTTLHTEHRLFLMFAIPPVRFRHFANQLGGIAMICKSKRLKRRVFHVVKSLFEGARKFQCSEMQYPRYEMLELSCVCNTSNTMWPTNACQALLRGLIPRPNCRC